MSSYLSLIILVFCIGLALSCCPVGWIAGYSSCYFLSTNTLKWSDASNVCRSMGSELAVINNALENQLLQGLNKNFQASFQHEFWIDGSDLLVEGHFVWASTQSDMDYNNWSKGEPNDLNGEDCVEIVHNSDNFTWNDAPCDTLQHFICERPQKNAIAGSSEIIG